MLHEVLPVNAQVAMNKKPAKKVHGSTIQELFRGGNGSQAQINHVRRYARFFKEALQRDHQGHTGMAHFPV